MGAMVKRTGVKVTGIWDEMATRQLGETAVTAITDRTFHRGQDVHDRPFEPYSRRPLYVSKKNARLAPKGGRETSGGQSVFYPDGFAGFKRESTGNERVNLVMSGELLRALAITRFTRSRVVIGVRGGAARYGAALQIAHKGRPARVWLGLSPRDQVVIRRAIAIIGRAAIARHTRRL